MPKFTVTRNWVELIGPIWLPPVTAAQRKDLSAYDPENMCDGAGEITRESVEHWLAVNSGDFQYVEDFAAYITDGDKELVFPWADEESEIIFNDCMSEE